jgi:hypothetical protein
LTYINSVAFSPERLIPPSRIPKNQPRPAIDAPGVPKSEAAAQIRRPTNSGTIANEPCIGRRLIWINAAYRVAREFNSEGEIPMIDVVLFYPALAAMMIVGAGWLIADRARAKQVKPARVRVSQRR